MQVKISQAVAIITAYIKAKLVPMLVGSPGMGKSQIVHQIAAEYGLKVIDIRLAQCDPTDLLGPLAPKGDRASYLPMDTFPLEGDPIPEGYSGWLVFMDELTSAPTSVQAASYKVILDRMIGQHHLHPNVVIVAAGNKETDGAIVNPMSTALQSRMVHLELVVDHGEWLDWAAANGIDHRVTDYIRFKPAMVYNFQPDHTDNTYACPRTWEFASRLLQSKDLRTMQASKSNNVLPALAGVLGEGVAREFVTFMKIYDQLPKPQQMIDSPESVKIPDEPSILYALTGTISHNADENNIGQLMKLIKRLPTEFQVVTLRDTVRRNKPLLTKAPVREWIKESSVELF